MRRFLSFHPFLFAIFPILFLAAYNMDEVSATDVILPILIVVATTAILMAVLRLFTNNRNKTGIVVFLFWGLFYTYGYVGPLLLPVGAWLGVLVWGHPVLFALISWACVGIACAVLVLKSSKSFHMPAKFLKIVAVTLVAIPLVVIGVRGIQSVHWGTSSEPATITNPQTQDTLPDIYYIILDAYARGDIIERFFDYDNAPFLASLTDRGFYVAHKSLSNYSCTITSLPSSLNMRTITDEERLGISSNVDLLCNNEVWRFLESKGYQYIFVSSGQFGKGFPKYADTYTPSRTMFGGTAFTTTDLMLSLIGMTPMETVVLQYFTHSHHRSGVLYAFETLGNMPDMPDIDGRPKFVFAHILSPHVPYVFNRDGSPPEGKGNYLDQLIFVNGKTMTLVDELLTKSGTPPIIILQGDHGYTLYPYQGGLEILNAYYLPGSGNNMLYDTISPINSFRVIFNLYFNADYELLDDKSGEPK